MFIYLPKHLTRLEVVSEMTRILNEYYTRNDPSENLKFFDYFYYYYTIDPVRNFIRMCLTDKYGQDLPDGILFYLIKLFYSVKGTPKVLDLMGTTLGLGFVPDSAGNLYTYSDYRISYELTGIESFNLDSFLEAQEKFLTALLYYYDLTALIDEAKLLVQEDLQSDVSILKWNYTSYEVGNTE